MKKARKTKDFGSPWMGKLLSLARKQAGFSSAAAAAAKYSWSESSMRAQERGGRAINATDAARYAKAFGLPEHSFQDAVHARIEIKRLERLLHASAAADSKLEAGLRLKAARKIRGFGSTVAAAEKLGLSQGTLAAHEAGTNRISDKWARTYGHAFSASPEWISTGALPSGLGEETDRMFADRSRFRTLDLSQLRPVPQDEHKASEAPPFDLMAPNSSEEEERSPPSLKDSVREISAAQVFGQGATTSAQRRWYFPQGFLAGVFHCQSTDIVALALDVPLGSFRPGDRIFIDTARTEIEGLGEFVCRHESGDVFVCDHRRETVDRKKIAVLGMILATFSVSGAPR